VTRYTRCSDPGCDPDTCSEESCGVLEDINLAEEAVESLPDAGTQAAG